VTVAVFTTVLGTTDPLRPPSSVNRQARYYCFADRETRVRPYEWVPVRIHQEPHQPYDHAARLASRQLKILANDPAMNSPDIVLWHDAAFQLRCDPVALAHEMPPETDMVAFRHPHRDRIEDEAVAIARLGYMTEAVVKAQVAAYREGGFRNQTTITSTGFSLRRCTDRVRTFNQLWWDEILRWGWRDQMSVDYAIWKTGLVAEYITGHYRDNPYARWFAPSRAERARLLEQARRVAAETR